MSQGNVAMVVPTILNIYECFSQRLFKFSKGSIYFRHVYANNTCTYV